MSPDPEPMKAVSVVGARPQFIKLSPIVRELELRQRSGSWAPVHKVIHTGQHYDYEMSQVFFDQLQLPPADYHLGIGSGSHGRQTGLMLAAIEEVLVKEESDVVLVYGDTNTTLAGALAAAKLHVRIAHVEAGLRSHNRLMPEETNRVVADRVSDILLCPSDTAVANLCREGFTTVVGRNGLDGPAWKSCSLGFPVVTNVGDVMYDALLTSLEVAEERSEALQRLSLSAKDYLLATVHRAENSDDHQRLRQLLAALADLGRKTKVIVPLHPRTKKSLESIGGQADLADSSVKIIPPVDYLDMLVLAKNARAILTDSGGVQKEAYWLGVPCITLRNETEWPETVEAGANTLVGTDPEVILRAAAELPEVVNEPYAYGDGHAARQIIDILEVLIR